MRLRMQNSKLYVVKLNEQDWELDQAVVICGMYICKDTKDKVKP